MGKLQYLPANISKDALCEVIAQDGAAIIEGVLDTGQLTQLKSEIMPYVEATHVGQDDFTGHLTTRTGALVARSATCRGLVMDDLILGTAQSFLKPYCEHIQLHLTQVIRIMPGQEKQVLHRDRLAWGGFIPDKIEPQLNTIWAVSDFSRENGATQVVPGSNKWDTKRKAEDSEIEYAEMAAGSVLVYSGSVIHGGGANEADHDRIGINNTYTLGWLRQEENQYLSCPPEIAKGFSPELRDLLGYTMGSYALGYFTPPTGPGVNPEVVPPEYLFDQKAAGWGETLYDTEEERLEIMERGSD